MTSTLSTGPVYRDCIHLGDYGYDLTQAPFIWKNEAIQFMSRGDVTHISGLNYHVMNSYLDVLTARPYYKGFKVAQDIVCTEVRYFGIDCFIKYIKYDALPEYGLYIAKIYLPGGIPSVDKFGNPVSLAFKSPDDYYYITQDGYLCYFKIPTEKDPDNNSDIKVIPDIKEDDTPIIGSGQVLTPISSITRELELEIKPIWPEYITNLSLIEVGNNTCKLMVSSGSLDNIDYVLDVYSPKNIIEGSIGECDTPIFKIWYGDYEGQGTTDLGGADSETLTKGIYTQFANILLPCNQSKFSIDNSELDSIYVIDFQRKYYNDAIDPKTFEMTLGRIQDTSDEFDPDISQITVPDWSYNNKYIVDLPDNFNINNRIHLRDSYNIVSGSLELGKTNDIAVGTIYPTMGFVVLSRTALEGGGRDVVRHTSYSGKNTYRLFKAICSIENDVMDASGDHHGFKVSGVKFNDSIYVTSRIKNYQFNFSNNPTFYTADTGGLNGIGNVYITQIGLYNKSGELMAVGKLSTPILKNSLEEMVITLKILH